ncbi:hypothetical protein ABIA31_006224 [Catenulispora sp. MAP5-51]
MDTTARGFESLRTRWDGGRRPRLVGAEDQEQAPARRAASARRDHQTPRGLRSECWSPLSRIPRRCRRRKRNHPGLAVSSRITRCCGPVSSDLTPPVRNDWQGPPTATRDPGQTHLWEGIPYYQLASHHRSVCVPEWTPSTPQTGFVPDSPSRRRAKPSRPGRWCQVADTRPPAGLSDLIPPDRSASVRRRCDGESGTKATTSNDRQQPAQPPLPGARPLAAQAPPEAPLTVAFDRRL